MRTTIGVALVGCGAISGACGGETKDPAVPENPAPQTAATAAPRASRSGMQVQTELGEIDQAGTERALQGAQPALGVCFQKGAARVEYLGGDVAFFVRVGQDGKAHWLYLEQSSLGDRDTERCMLDVLARVTWPRPQGGEAEVRKAIGFDPLPSVRPPAPWTGDKMAAAVGALTERLEACKGDAKGRYAVTMYVEPDGRNGKVQAVGAAPPSKDGESKVDCIVAVLREAKVPSPGSYAAKVSFAL